MRKNCFFNKTPNILWILITINIRACSYNSIFTNLLQKCKITDFYKNSVILILWGYGSMSYTTDCIKHNKRVFNLKAEKAFREANDSFYSRNYDRALELLQETVSLDPYHEKAFMLKGDIMLMKEGNEKQAIDAYDMALRSNPKNSQALGSKAYVLDILGQFKSALECCDKAFSCVDTKDKDQLCSLYEQKLSLLCSLKEYDKAQAVLTESIENLPEENSDYLKSCFLSKIRINKAKNKENQPNLKLIF